MHLVHAQLEDPRHLIAVHVWRLSASENADTVAPLLVCEALGIARLRFDVGMLHQTGGECSPSHMRCPYQRLVHVAFGDPPANQNIVGSKRVQRRLRTTQRFLYSEDGLLRLPFNGQIRFGDRHDALVFAYERDHRLAAKADMPVGQHGLILDLREDAEAVLGNVAGRQDIEQSGVALLD